MLTEYSFMVIRAEDCRLSTTMRCNMTVQSPDNDGWLTAADLREKVRTACTAWVKGLPAGRAAWIESGEDFNIGDLAEHQDDAELVVELNKVGIRQLKLESMPEAGNWAYDDRLVRRDELP